MKLPPLPVFYISTGLSLVTLGDSLLYTILPSYFPILGLAPLQIGIILSVNRWISAWLSARSLAGVLPRQDFH
jgi:hypothetical protein